MRGLVLTADAIDGWWSKSDNWKDLSAETRRDLLTASRWVRGMVRIQARRGLARAMNEEHEGRIYVKAPPFDPAWFGKPGHHIKREATS